MGEVRSVHNRGPRRGRERQHAQNRVTCSRQIEYLPARRASLDARLAHPRVAHFMASRRNVHLLWRRLLKYTHSFSTSCDHHGAAAKASEQCSPRLLEGFFIRQSLGHVKTRSEERRVGKECRSRWSPYH